MSFLLTAGVMLTALLAIIYLITMLLKKVLK